MKRPSACPIGWKASSPRTARNLTRFTFARKKTVRRQTESARVIAVPFHQRKTSGWR